MPSTSNSPGKIVREKQKSFSPSFERKRRKKLFEFFGIHIVIHLVRIINASITDLLLAHDDTVTVETEGQNRVFERKDIALVRLYIEF